jgi:hypothetical protein
MHSDDNAYIVIYLAFRCEVTRKQLKQTCFFLARVLYCPIGIDRNSSHCDKLCDPVQLTHFKTDTLLTKERDLFRELSVTELSSSIESENPRIR